MAGDLVIGLDSSTQSTKAIAWDATGNAVAEGRAPIAMANPGYGWFEQNPDDWRKAARVALAECTAKLDPTRVAALAISNQRETIGFLDADGRPVRPAMVWLDERARAEVTELAERLGVATLHETSGRPVDLIPCIYRIAWLRKHEPEAFAATRTFADVQTVLVQDLCGGPPRTGWISADPMGLFDIRNKTWSGPLMEAVGLDETRLPQVLRPGTRIGEIARDAASATGLAEGLPVLAAGGDGQLAGLGTNCTDPSRAYANLGTAVVSGVWTPDFAVGDGWRTEIAAQGEGYILENCIRAGAFLINWFVDGFAGGREDSGVFDRLEKEASALPIGSEGIIVTPYFMGVMDPHWDTDARGVILGLSGSHGQAHIYRAILEGMTLWLASATAAMEKKIGSTIDHYVAIGGGANSPLWRQMLADASGRTVRLSGTIEASALGAGMIAAFGAGWYDSIEAAAAGMAGETLAIEPDPANAERYAELAGIFEMAYPATAAINRRLVGIAARGAGQ